MGASPSQSLHHNIERLLFDEEKIRARIRELGRQISADYAGRDLMLIGILKGSVLFLADLMRGVTVDCIVDFMAVSSYAGTTASSGAVRLVLDLRESAEGKDILIVEDVVDTGLTLRYLEGILKPRKPRSLAVCALLDKPDCRMAKVEVKYVGFKIPNEFVVGFGLDYQEKYRNFPYIGILKKGVVTA